MIRDLHVLIEQQEGIELPGILSVPTEAKGLVLFAHGSGSSRLSPRNRQVAHQLNTGSLATLLFDLLSEDEAQSREAVFDIPLLADRLRSVTAWARSHGSIGQLPIGYFGASTGAAAALWAAAEPNSPVRAVVSRGGRPDLALQRLQDVRCPTLLIVGGEDEGVIELNEIAQARLPFSELLIIPGATHLFEEPGALNEVGRASREWFLRHLVTSRASSVA